MHLFSLAHVKCMWIFLELKFFIQIQKETGSFMVLCSLPLSIKCHIRDFQVVFAQQSQKMYQNVWIWLQHSCFLTFHHRYGCSGHLRLCRYYSASEIGWLILTEKQYFVRTSLKGHANKVFRYENHWVFFTLSSPISHTNSSAWSPYISLKSYSREFDEKLKHFFFGDHFTNSQNLFSWLWMDIVGKKLILVTLGA